MMQSNWLLDAVIYTKFLAPFVVFVGALGFAIWLLKRVERGE